MKFLNPEMLWHLVWVLPLMIAGYVYAQTRRKQVLKRLTGANSFENPEIVCSPAMRRFRFFVLLLAVTMLFCALARPSWKYQIQEIKGSGRDLLVLFDTSKSMLCKDVQPSRLEHAKWVVRELVKANPGDRFGLIAFAGKAFLECPLTVDRTSFLQILSELSTDSIPVGGTNIQESLETALKAFSAAEAMHRAVILVTDGDELYGDSGKAVEEIVARKIPLFVIGVGDPTQPSIIQVPDGKGGVHTLKDAQGNAVNSPLNEKQLALLAEKTGGIFVRSTAANPEISAVEKRIRALNAGEYDAVKMSKPIERFAYPLWAAFLLMLLWMCTSERGSGEIRTAKSVVLILAFSLMGNMFAQAGSSSLPAEQPVSADERKTEEIEPAATPEETFNRGVEAQESGDTETAGKNYISALETAGVSAELAGRASQNLGVLSHLKARAAFDESVKTLQSQQLEAAEKKVEESLKQMEGTEKMYREAMREVNASSALSKNQSILLAEREKAEELKKKIEELKKMQQQAQQQTQDAKNQQQQQNQQQQNQQDKSQQNQQQQNQQDKSQQNQQQQNQQQQNQQQQNQQQQNQQQQNQQQQNQQQQNQQDKSQQSQQQQNQQDKSQQNRAEQKTSEARQSAEKLEQQARELGQKQMEQQAKTAKEELEKAQREQQKNNGEKAEEHLNKASEALGKPNDQKSEQGKDESNKDQQKSEQNKDESNKDQQKSEQGKDESNKDQQKSEQGKDDEKLPKEQPEQGESGEENAPKEDEIDKGQAESVLDMMAGEEKALRDELKDRQKQNSRIAPVTKDW